MTANCFLSCFRSLDFINQFPPKVFSQVPILHAPEEVGVLCVIGQALLAGVAVQSRLTGQRLSVLAQKINEDEILFGTKLKGLLEWETGIVVNFQIVRQELSLDRREMGAHTAHTPNAVNSLFFLAHAEQMWMGRL